MSYSIQNSGNVDIDYIVNEASTIYKKLVKTTTSKSSISSLNVKQRQKVSTRIKKSRLNPVFNKSFTKESARIAFFQECQQNTHKELMGTYPVMGVQLCLDGHYSEAAFRSYLEWLARNMWETEEEMWVRQVAYIHFLYKEIDPKYEDRKSLYDTKCEEHLNALREEKKQMEDIIRKAKERIAKRAEEGKQEREEILRSLLNKSIKTGTQPQMQFNIYLPEQGNPFAD